MKIVRDFSSKRWEGIRRDYTPQDVERLGGTIEIKYTLAEMGGGAPVAPPAKRAVRRRPRRGTGYFDEVAKVISDGEASTIALEGSTEAAQF
jgi:isocitrate lyase